MLFDQTNPSSAYWNPQKVATGWAKTKLALFGYNANGTQNDWGRINSWIPGANLMANESARQIASENGLTDVTNNVKSDLDNRLQKLQTVFQIGKTALGAATANPEMIASGVQGVTQGIAGTIQTKDHPDLQGNTYYARFADGGKPKKPTTIVTKLPRQEPIPTKVDSFAIENQYVWPGKTFGDSGNYVASDNFPTAPQPAIDWPVQGNYESNADFVKRTHEFRIKNNLYATGGKPVSTNGIYPEHDKTSEDIHLIDKKTGKKVGEMRYEERIFDQLANKTMEELADKKDDKALGKFLRKELDTHPDRSGKYQYFAGGGKITPPDGFKKIKFILDDTAHFIDGSSEPTSQLVSRAKGKMVDLNTRNYSSLERSEMADYMQGLNAELALKRQFYMDPTPPAPPVKTAPKPVVATAQRVLTPSATNKTPTIVQKPVVQAPPVQATTKRPAITSVQPPNVPARSVAGTLLKRQLEVKHSPAPILPVEPVYNRQNTISALLPDPNQPIRNADVTAAANRSTSVSSPLSTTSALAASFSAPTGNDATRWEPGTSKPIAVNSDKPKTDWFGLGGDALRSITSAVGADQQLPTRPVNPNLLQMQREMADKQNEGLSAAERINLLRDKAATQAYAVQSIKDAVGGGGSASSVLSALNNVDSRANQMGLNLEESDRQQRQQNKQNYYVDLQNSQQASDNLFTQQYNTALNNKNAFTQALGANLQNMTDRNQYNNAYGPGSSYYNLQLQMMKRGKNLQDYIDAPVSIIPKS